MRRLTRLRRGVIRGRRLTEGSIGGGDVKGGAFLGGVYGGAVFGAGEEDRRLMEGRRGIGGRVCKLLP